MMTDERTVNVNYVARVEGEGAVSVKIRDGSLEDLRLSIFEPPRFFEALLRGRSYEEAPDITARICGICPVAYQMSSCHAMEKAVGVIMDDSLRDLRRLLYAGEWIESHVLHIYLLHLPDFTGHPDALTLAREQPSVVKKGLELKKAGNTLISVLGGRSVHPVNVRVGGFYRVPAREELLSLRSMLEHALDIAAETVRFTAGLEFPSVEENYEFVALTHPREYPMNEGVITSTDGLHAPVESFEAHFEEVQVPYSNAYQVVRRGKGSYLTGPLARYALNHDRLTPEARDLSHEIGLKPVERNPNRSIVVRALEVVLACEESLAIIDRYTPPDHPFIPPAHPVIPGSYAAITEAPRGMLFHRYRLSSRGIIEDARIVAPTTQNQRRIEDDLKHMVPRLLDFDDRRLADACERAIRNHDPCISCATHFLDFRVERS